MNHTDKDIKSVLTQTYRPQILSTHDAAAFDRAVHQRVKRSIAVRIAVIGAIALMLATTSWQLLVTADEKKAPSATQDGLVNSDRPVVDERAQESWPVILMSAWDEIDDVATTDLGLFDSNLGSNFGAELPDSLTVVSGIVELAYGKDSYQ